MISTYLANTLLDATLGNPAYPPSLSGPTFGGSPTNRTLYVALFTTPPISDGTGGTEVSGVGYARAAVLQSVTNWPAASAGSKASGTAVSWGTAAGSWGTVIAFGIYDALTGGNLLFVGTLTQPQAVADNDSVQVPAGGLVVSLA